jgi:type II secretory pathway pseudopilin PulG
MKLCPKNRGYKLIELVFTTVLIGVLGLIIYSILNMGTILGAKNTAVNSAHQQARTAMLQMVQDLHSAISLPSLCDSTGAAVSGQGPAAGIAFQLFSGGPYKINADATTSDNTVDIKNPTATMSPVPVVGQRLIIPGHQIEDDITAVTKIDNKTYTLTLAHTLPVAINNTASYVIPCFLTDRCSYIIQNQTLDWTGPTSRKAFSVMGNNITSPTPFTTPTTAAGALYYRFVAAIDLSTSDLNYNNRGFKSANILLNGQVPMRARLTTYQ